MTTRRSVRAAKHAQACGRKQGHRTRESAVAAMRALVKARGARPGGLRVYQCAACHLWHFGNLPGTRRA